MKFYILFGRAHLPNPALPGVAYGDLVTFTAGQPSLAHRRVKRLLGRQFTAWGDVVDDNDRIGAGPLWDQWFPGSEHPIEKFEPPATVTWRRERRAA